MQCNGSQTYVNVIHDLYKHKNAFKVLAEKKTAAVGISAKNNFTKKRSFAETKPDYFVCTFYFTYYFQTICFESTYK